MIRVIINRVIKSVIRHSDKNLNNVTFSGIASSRAGLGRAYELELLPLVIVLIAAFVCLVSIVVTVVKIVYDYCNEINEEDPAPEESEIPALSSHSPDYETAEIEAEESKKLTGEIRKEYNADSYTSGGE